MLGDGFEVKMPEDKVGIYTPYDGHDVIFGIRPEDIHNPQFTPPSISQAIVKASVDVTELMGNEIFLYLLTGGTSYVARVDPRSRYDVGQEVEVSFNMDNIHIFDKESDPENPIAIR